MGDLSHYTLSTLDAKMSAGLIDLSDEVLAQIFNYIDAKTFKIGDKHHSQSTRSTICSLVRTCRRTSPVAFSELYRNISFDLDEVKFAPSWEQVRCVNQFLRTCRSRPGVLQHIRTVSIIWHVQDDEDAALESLLGALGPSKSLTDLHLDLGEVDYDLGMSPCALRPLLQHDREFLSLQTLEILTPKDNERDLSIELFYKLASLPSLKHLTIHNSVDEPEETDFAQAPQNTQLGRSLDLKDQQFDLHSLEVIGNPCEQALEVMLPRCRGIRKLKTYVSGLEDAMYGEEDMYLRPRTITQSMLPVVATLQELSLKGPSDALFAYTDQQINHDGSIMCLSPFKSLRRLETSMMVLSMRYGQTLEAKTLRSMFPSSLQELCIHYESPRGVFCTVKSFIDMREIANQYELPNGQRELEIEDFNKHFKNETNSTEDVKQRLGWFLSLLNVRKSHASVLPNLKKLDIVEVDDVAYTFDNFMFVKGGYYPELFEDIDVEFEIVLRCPKGCPPPALRGIDELPADEPI